MRALFLFLCTALLLSIHPLRAADDSSRPSPDTVRQWQSRKYGMFIHFGLYSMLGGVWKGKQYSGNYSEQIQSDAKIPEAEYAALAGKFQPDRWDADAIVRLAQDAGMQFIVLTAKHHDGFSLFRTQASTFNVLNASPYGKDIVQTLTEACARHHMPFGVYYSTIDWHFGDVPTQMNDNPISPEHEEFNVTQLRELMTHYGPLSEVWFDMGHPTKLQSKHFADTVHKYQPQTMVSGRVFNNEGDFMEMGDDEIPDYILDEPWESPASIYKQTWGYRSWLQRTDLEGKIHEHIQRLVAVVSRGGNYILNIGPKGDGSVVEYESEVLRGMGVWLKRNGEAIYGTQPQPFRKLDFGYATVRDNRLYLFAEHIPADRLLKLPGMQNHIRNAYVLGDGKRNPLALHDDRADKSVEMPTADSFLPVVVVEFEGSLDVRQPAMHPDANGALALTPETADHFYNANGEGYYDPPTLRKERWNFTVNRAGKYRVEVAYQPGKFARLLDIDVNGKVLRTLLYGRGKSPATAGVVELTPEKESVLTIARGAPAERGSPLDVGLVRISVVPVREAGETR
jgi:alpha-L-fucosidase